MHVQTTDPRAPEPVWLRDWLAGAADPNGLLPHLPDFPEEVRQAYVRYPPGCVVQCACGAPTCSASFAILSMVLKRLPDGCLVLFLVRSPDGPVVELLEEETRLRVIGYRGGLTPDVMRVLLRPTGLA